MTWGIWGKWAGALSAVNKCRIFTHGCCGKWHADITANSVTLCKISTCGDFCRYFTWIGNISNILVVWYFGQSPVKGVHLSSQNLLIFWQFWHRSYQWFCICVYIYLKNLNLHHCYMLNGLIGYGYGYRKTCRICLSLQRQQLSWSSNYLSTLSRALWDVPNLLFFDQALTSQPVFLVFF